MDQHLLQESWNDMRKGGGGYASSRPGSSGPPSPASFAQPAGPVDTVLYRNLVEMVPLVQSLMDNRSNKSFGRYATMVFTPNPASRKINDQKGRKTPQTTRGTLQRAKQSLPSENGKDNFLDDPHHFSDVENENNNVTNAELLQLRSRIEDLEKKLTEKQTELTQSRENSSLQIEEMKLKLEQLTYHVEEKDGLIKAAHLQLCHKKNELTDAKMLQRKAEEEYKASQIKARKLEDDLNILRYHIATFASILDATGMRSTREFGSEGFGETGDSHSDDNDMENIEEEEGSASSYIKREELEEIEQAKRMYLAAVVAARNKPAEESLSLTATLRSQLQQFLKRPSLENALSDQLAAHALGSTIS